MAGFTYITTNKNKTVLYVGATNDIVRRIIEHKTKVYRNSFTAKYNCDLLVYFEEYENTSDAFLREKQLKAGNRKKKEALINEMNPEWKDLAINWKDENFKLR
ncbi:GIY-YIG nuclease family protein [Aequorivita marina]|uniref:GIY-YIG nuclease family protein n=1 Tax=Aequorivita marina TaxID=3073654 RepID=UPI0028769531|nr:GIY-YIG nuclease family protein [Aequorivita sp. S2608]MDS1299021.1 GIY-YIG nuclease family protein [Aequorivita sp. S2608]